MHSLMHQYVHQVWWISQLQSQILPKSCATSSMVQAMTTRFNHTALWTGGAVIMEPPGLIPLPQAGSVMFLTSSMSLTEMTSPRTMWIGASSGSWKRSDFQEIGRGGNLLVEDQPTNPISLHAAPRERSSLKKDPGNWQTPWFHREAREVGLHWASPWSTKSLRVTANQTEAAQTPTKWKEPQKNPKKKLASASQS